MGFPKFQTNIVAEKLECKTILDCTTTNAKQFTESHTSAECKGTFWNYNLHWLLSHLRITEVVTSLIGSSPYRKEMLIGSTCPLLLAGRRSLLWSSLQDENFLPCQGLTYKPYAECTLLPKTSRKRSSLQKPPGMMLTTIPEPTLNPPVTQAGAQQLDFQKGGEDTFSFHSNISIWKYKDVCLDWGLGRPR